MQFNPTLRAELAQLDTKGVLKLLGEILEPSVNGPIDIGDDADDFYDALTPVIDAYGKAYAKLDAIADPQHDPDAAMYDRADYLYECARDKRMERELGW